MLNTIVINKIGAGYFYSSSDGSAWSQSLKVVPSDGSADDHFAVSLALNNNVAAFGSSLDDDKGSNSGTSFCLILFSKAI